MNENTTALVDVALAQEKLAEVEQLSAKLAAAEVQLEGGYAKLAFLLKDVSEHRYWQGTYKSFGEFLGHITQTYQIGKSQLYNFMSTAKELQNQLGEAELNTMGISKALVLRDVRAASGHDVPDTVVQQALDPKVTVKDLKKLLYDAGQLTQPEEGVWMDLDFSCYVTDEERATIQDAMTAARRLDPPINEKTKDSVQFKEILLRFAQEFLGAYAEEE